MDTLQLWLILAMVGAGAALALGVLFVLAVKVRDECDLHDLIVEAHKLRLKQARRIAMLSDDEPDIEIIEPEPAGQIEYAAEARQAA
jgi:hypothetical protein